MATGIDEMHTIFLSYRRSTTGFVSKALNDLMLAHPKVGHVFVDIDAVSLGDSFAQALESRIAESDFVMVLISQGWLATADPSGLRRIDHPEDFVRREIELAFRLGVPIVPVLIDGAPLPGQDELPYEIQDLAHIHPFRVSSQRLEMDVENLVSALERSSLATPQSSISTNEPSERRSEKRTRSATGLAVQFFLAVVLIGAILLYSMWTTSPMMDDSNPPPVNIETDEPILSGERQAATSGIINQTQEILQDINWRDWLQIGNTLLLLLLVAAILMRRRDQISSDTSSKQKVVTKPELDRVFISYRRADAPYATSYLFERLTSALGSGVAFKDVDSIPLGVDFRDHINSRLQNCQVALVVIGSNWLLATDDAGKQRLLLEDDPVRTEIEVLLERGIPVIPILVDGMKMPPKESLPSEIRELADRQAVPLRPDPDFASDMQRLAGAL